MASFTGRCKKCGGVDLSSYDSIIGTAGITGFTQNDVGEFEPDYDGETDVDWNSQQAYDETRPYRCQGCWELLGVNDIDFIEEKEEGEDGHA